MPPAKLNAMLRHSRKQLAQRKGKLLAIHHQQQATTMKPVKYYCRACKREFGQGGMMPAACTLCKSTNIIGRAY